MPKYKEKRTPISGTASTTSAPSRPRTPAGPSGRMTESIPSATSLPGGSVPLPRKTFDDQKRVNSVYRWK